MRLIDADKSDEIIVFDKQNELLQCSVVRDYCERQREFLNKFPTIDAVEVVRCKDCCQWEDFSPNKGWGEKGYCRLSEHATLSDDFCSYGKRKGVRE